MQPDGTLNPSAEPKELPDPSDSDASYWLARTIWALGEGYAAFRARDPAFAGFLQAPPRPRRRRARPPGARPRTASYLDIDGQPDPGLADRRRRRRLAPRPCSGLAAYVQAGGSAARPHRAGAAQRRHRRSCRGGDARTWPFGARPALGAVPLGLARLGLADAGRAGPRRPARSATRSLARVAATRLVHVRPVAAHLRWPGQRPACPTRSDRVADRLRRRLAGAVAARHRRRRTAGTPASASPGSPPPGSSAPTRPARRCTTRPPGSPTTAISGDGTVNHNSGAESTIHGLLTMLALDAAPCVAAARPHRRRRRPGRHDDAPGRGRATLSGDAHAVAAGLAVDRRVALRRHRLRWPSRDGGTATSHPARAARPLAACCPVVDLQPGQHRPSRRSPPAVGRSAASRPAHRRAGRLARRPARCCRRPCRGTLPGRGHAPSPRPRPRPAGTRPGSTR